ncbi:hypothetical protein D3C81_1717440 [compost metagenome]
MADSFSLEKKTQGRPGTRPAALAVTPCAYTAVRLTTITGTPGYVVSMLACRSCLSREQSFGSLASTIPAPNTSRQLLTPRK